MSSTLTTTYRPGFYEKIILGMFLKMRSGSLHLTLPSGVCHQIGTPGIGVAATLEIRDPKFFKRCALYGDIGFGESYVEGEWDSSNITDLIQWFILNLDHVPTISGSKTKSLLVNMLKFFNKRRHALRQNSIGGSRKNIAEHYDLSNAFFELFLDPTMTYSSAYFKEKDMTLREAQLAKYDRLCRQLDLRPADHVLEIGSGWGGNALYMARQYGCKVTTLTISEEQYKLASQKVHDENLGHLVTVVLKDYRMMEGSFDKIVSIEMLEAVGAEYYTAYFKKCSELLKQNGTMALQVITCPDSRFQSMKNNVDWVQKHIFPGSLIPSVSFINTAIHSVCDLTLINLKDIGLDYAHTLKIWHREFNKKLGEVRKLGFDEAFIRKWNYYLCYCEAAFASRHIYVMQLVYTRPNNPQR